MFPRRHRAILCSALCCLLTSCTTVAMTKKGAVGFNRVFADARNEVLLLNILRAKDGEPLQFSTISTVSGNMRPDMKVTGGLDNLFIGAAKVFNPAGEFGFRNPTITIAPLETKEFRQGMMKPVKIEFIEELINEGWDPKTVFHLVVAGIKCGDAKKGPEFMAQFAESAEWKTAVKKDPDKPAEAPAKSVAVTAAEATKMLREGAGDSVELEIVESLAGDGPNTVRVQFNKPKPQTFLLDRHSRVCGDAVAELPAKNLILRSPSGMIQYLGKLAGNESGGNAYFQVVKAPGRIPQDVLVGTRFRHNLYYVPRDGKAPTTMALLAEIIGFQTMDASLNASKPTLTVSQD